LVSPLVKDGVNFDPSKLSWIGTASTDLQTCISWHAGPVKTADDLRKVDSVFGATGRDDIRYISADVLRKVLGANIKIVPGYPGTSDIRLALENRRSAASANPGKASRPPSRIGLKTRKSTCSSSSATNETRNCRTSR